MTLRLWCRPGATFEPGRLKVLIAPPDRMASLLALPEIGSFHTLYLFHGYSEVLFRVPPIRSEHFETQVCERLDDMIAAVSRSYHTVLMVEWSPVLAAGLDAEERGRRMSRLVRALRRRAADGIVIAYAPAMDGALQHVSLEADQTVWLVPEPAPVRPTVAVAARAKGQRTLV
ncbi:MAG TPA: hypothetical protein PLI31_09685 [Methanoregulaceae archaeon]|nr:hypothetical protein [Methanoregulaceae archaeon]